MIFLYDFLVSFTWTICITFSIIVPLYNVSIIYSWLRCIRSRDLYVLRQINNHWCHLPGAKHTTSSAGFLDLAQSIRWLGIQVLDRIVTWLINSLFCWSADCFEPLWLIQQYFGWSLTCFWYRPVKEFNQFPHPCYTCFQIHGS